MKPAPFVYHRPRTLDDAVRILHEVAPQDGRVLAGGQSLAPMMAFRLATPGHLVDINRIAELARLETHDDRILVGAGVRHAAFERPAATDPTDRLLARVAAHIAHWPIRTRGTFCGSLAHADPASEWCLTAVTLGASLRARRTSGERVIKADAFFEGVMATALEADEILVEASLPKLAPDARWGFQQASRRAGDFALGSVLVTGRLEAGRIADLRCGVGGVEDRPRRLAPIEEMLTGQTPGRALFEQAGAQASALVEPMEDETTPPDYRRDLVRALVARALEGAFA
jgi:carbon-monoxide dehydrogenase medium subunit